MEQGTTLLLSGPITNRTQCGTTKPTKPITPHEATQKATISVVDSSSTRFTRSTSTPRLRAVSLPANSRFKSRL